MRHAVAALSLLAAVTLPAHAADRPNFVIVLADDLGVECVGAYGGRSYKTPNIDKLAAGGIRFNHCFADPYCSPSRAQLLTGVYPLHNGITRVLYDPQVHREFLDPAQHVSFARRLKDAGYATAIAGKWQLSFLNERDTIREFGFDEYQCWQIFADGRKTSRYAEPTMRQNGRIVARDQIGDYGPDANLAFLTDFMERHRDQPFCAYYTCLLPHYPWEPTPDSGVPLKAVGDAGVGDKKYMPDMVAYLDKQVGQLVAKLEQLGLRENTVVIFTADNGTDQRLVSQWGNGAVTRQVHGGKGTLTDAGTHVPLVVNWPGRIAPGSPGRTCDDLVDLSDIMPTLLDLANLPPQPNINGVSFAPRLRDEPFEPRRWVHVQREGERYVRSYDYIVTNRGAMRPVVEIGLKPADPITDSLDADQQRARDELAAALKTAAATPPRTN